MGSTGFIAIPEDAKSLVWTDIDGTAEWLDGSPAGYVTLAGSLNYGAGRVFAVADGNFLSDTDNDADASEDYFDLSNEHLCASAMIWLSASGIVEKTVLLEESHSPYYSHVSLTQFTRFLSFNGFNVRWTSAFSEQLIDEADVMFIMTGAVENYTAPEKEAIHSFVGGGGSLFLICDWTGYQVMANDIIEEYGMNINGTSYLSDSNDGTGSGDSQITYNGTNIANHPIMNSVYRIEVDRSPAFSSIGIGTALVSTDEDGTCTWAAGGDAIGLPVIAAAEYNMGRVVVLPDINFLSHLDADGDGSPTMYDSDNDIFLANAFYWLIENRAPSVEVITPNGGELINGTITVEWNAVDFDSDPLSFDVLYSDDNGSSWDDLATGVTSDNVSWNTSLYADGNGYMIRVIVTDGVETAHDDSDAPFELDNFDETLPPGPPLDPQLLLIIGAGVLVVVIVLVIVMKKKK